MDTEGATLLIADCHIHAHSDAEGDFFEMLDRIAVSAPARVVFLGDIFDLWIALDGYESFGHHQFIEWCTRYRHHFEIGFIEGNHEYFIKKSYPEAFTWITDTEHPEGEFCFSHGDLINKGDWKYRLMRFLLRNRLVHFLLNLTSGSIGPRVAATARVLLASRGPKHTHALPMPQLTRYGDQAADQGFRRVYAGHFHNTCEITAKEKTRLRILPAWEVSEEIVMVLPDGREICGNWREILN